MAIKVLNKKKLDDPDANFFFEINFQKEVESKNILKIYDFLSTDLDFYIILEFCNLGDLESVLKKSAPIDHYHLLIDILRGFLVMIKKGIIHRDLKPANILLHRKSNKVHFKLCDFGFAKQITNLKNSKLTSKVGTPLYMSP